MNGIIVDPLEPIPAIDSDEKIISTTLKSTTLTATEVKVYVKV